jgi:hypothetical protein
MARGDHRLSKVLLGLAMLYPSTPCGGATHETVLRAFQEWPVRRTGGLQPSSTILATPRRTPLVPLFPAERRPRLVVADCADADFLVGSDGVMEVVESFRLFHTDNRTGTCFRLD